MSNRNRNRNPKRKRREYDETKDPKTTTDSINPSDFSFTLTRVAVSQICQSAGFKLAQSSALETLTLITTKYIETLAKWSSSFSQQANRTESNVFDIVNALHDLSMTQGFPGGSNLHDGDANCLLKSSVLKELSDFVKYSPEIPFAKPIPREIGTGEPMFMAAREENAQRGGHIQEWLPAFPAVQRQEEKVSERQCGLGEKFDSTILSTSKVKAAEEEEVAVGGRLEEERDRVKFRIIRKTQIENIQRMCLNWEEDSDLN